MTLALTGIKFTKSDVLSNLFTKKMVLKSVKKHRVFYFILSYTLYAKQLFIFYFSKKEFYGCAKIKW